MSVPEATRTPPSLGVPTTTASPSAEFTALCAFYGLPASPLLERHGANLETYAEWVLDAEGFAFVTLAAAADLAGLAEEPAAGRFARAAGRWSEAITGTKIDVAGRVPPTLYVRAVCPWDEGAAWLEHELGGLPPDLPRTRTFYGVGFQGHRSKIYALAPEGFVSWRIEDATGSVAGSKRYTAEVPWATIPRPDARWRALGELGERLGFQTAGHVGFDASTGARKLYVERRGAIPTDRSLS